MIVNNRGRGADSGGPGKSGRGVPLPQFSDGGFDGVQRRHPAGAVGVRQLELHQGRAGYLVYTVFELDDRNPSILVNRGWIGAEADRSRAPRFDTPTTSQRLDGRLSSVRKGWPAMRSAPSPSPADSFQGRPAQSVATALTAA